MRVRTTVLAALLLFGVIAPATTAAADVCYDLDLALNGMVLVDEADCIES